MNKELYITNLLNKIADNPQKALKHEDNSIYPSAFNCLRTVFIDVNICIYVN